MSTLIIEHVKISELPELWRAKLPMAKNARVTVRIETETADETENDPLFGLMWKLISANYAHRVFELAW